ncbi:MAG: hypothetical protein ABIS06_02025 [Vicinamibacterales bacterium]
MTGPGVLSSSLRTLVDVTTGLDVTSGQVGTFGNLYLLTREYLDMCVTGFSINPFRKAQASGRTVNGVFVPAPAGVFVDANFKLQARPR